MSALDFIRRRGSRSAEAPPPASAASAAALVVVPPIEAPTATNALVEATARASASSARRQLPPLDRRSSLRSGQRSYKAAATNRLTGGLPARPTSPDQESARHLRTLRARSRWEVRNNDIARRVLSLYDTGVIGLGINLYGQVTNRDGTPDEQANLAIEDGWRNWCKAGNCEVTGMSFWAAQRLFERATIEDGEVFVRIHQGREYGPWGIQIEMIDPELVEVLDNRQLSDGAVVRMGIEYGDSRRPRAYWVVVPDPRLSPLAYGYESRRRVQRVDAADMLHGFLRERVGESRGTPRLANCLLRLAHLEGAEDAALVALRVGAEKLAWLKYDETAKQYTGTDQGVEGDDPNEPVHRIVDSDIGEFGELPPGVSIEKWEPNYPNNEYAPFQKRLLQNISSGVDLPYFEVGNDLEGVNFSSAKIGQMTEHDTFAAHQQYVIESFCEPIFQIWLYNALALGKLTFPDSGLELPFSKRDRYSRVRFQPRTWEGADRLKESMADVVAVESMHTTLSDVIRKRSGRDFQDVLKERQREIAAMSAAGIPQSPGLNEQLLKMAMDEDGGGQPQKKEGSNAEAK